MRIVFVHDWEPSYFHIMTWQDGLAAALKVLSEKGHSVTVITCGKEEVVVKHPYFDVQVTKDVRKLVKQIEPQVVLMWADATRPNAAPVRTLGIPMALCFAGGEPLGETYPYFDHIFTESQVYSDVFDQHEMPNSIAFGTNTTLFAPMQQNKLIDAIFPGTFAYWKRHNLFAQATEGLAAVAVGHIQPNGMDEDSWKECLQRGVTLLPHVTAETLRNLYAASRVCVVPSMSSGGSQRTVLEAMAMNLPLIITDSDKFDYARGHGAYEAEPTKESIAGFIDAILDGEAEADTRQYVVDNWSEFTYADSLERGLEGLL